MTISIDVSEEPDNNWNNRLSKSSMGTIYQSIEISTHFKNIGQTPLFLKFIDSKGNIVGQVLIRIYVPNNDFKRKSYYRIFNKKVCEWSYGPIIFDSEYKNEIFEKFGKYLLENKFKISGTVHPLISNQDSFLENNFKIIPWSTYIIDLEIDKDKLFKNISKSNGQKNIKRAKKRGVIVEEINEKNLFEFHDLRSQVMKLSNSSFQDYDVTKKWWNLLQPLGYSGFLAKYEEKCIGALMFSHYCDHIIEGSLTRSQIDFTENLYSQDLIKWEIIEWGKENKKKIYNLAGFNPHPISKKEEGIKKYKQKWGGQKFDYYIIRK
jgi:lipid II:glycine glycyltransferase (peptidoglycan interpeptide bridge formation enzyme)